MPERILMTGEYFERKKSRFCTVYCGSAHLQSLTFKMLSFMIMGCDCICVMRVYCHSVLKSCQIFEY